MINIYIITQCCKAMDLIRAPPTAGRPIVISLSVRPSVRPSVRLSVRNTFVSAPYLENRYDFILNT